MNRIILTIFALLLGYNISAQSYQCFVPGSRQYYINANNYLRGIRIDSVKLAGDTTIYYPFHTLRGAYDKSSLTSVPVDSNGGSWLGKKVTRLPDGTFLFDDEWNDTIVIKTQANIGDRWIFYKDTSDHYYMANLTSIDTMTISGILDTVKQIDILSYYDTSILTSDSLNGIQILLSAHHGFIKIFDLYTFPYYNPDSISEEGIDYFLDLIVAPSIKASISNQQFQLINLYNLPKSQLYDWQVGDVFQFAKCFQHVRPDCNFARAEYDVDTVMAKDITPSGTDFLLNIKQSELDYNPLHPSLSYTTTIQKNVISTIPNDLVIDTTKMPEEYKAVYFYYYYPNDSSFCRHSPSYELFEDDFFNGILAGGFHEASYPLYIYKKGLGLIKYNFTNYGDPGEDDITLLYAYMNGLPCGTYSTAAIETVPQPRTIIKIYPNPCNGDLYIENINSVASSSHILIYSITGNKVYETILPTWRLEHIHLNIPDGLYFVKCYTDDLSYTYKLTVIRN